MDFFFNSLTSIKAKASAKTDGIQLNLCEKYDSLIQFVANQFWFEISLWTERMQAIKLGEWIKKKVAFSIQ